MKFSAEDFRRLYAEMPDEELRSLVRDELSEVARPRYDEELKRHLKPGTGYFEPTPMWDEAQSWDDALFS